MSKQHSTKRNDTIRGSPIPSDWSTATIGGITDGMADGGTPDRSEEEKYFGGDINWVVVKDVHFTIKDSVEKLTEEGLQASSATLWPEGSVIVTTGASIGKVGVAEVPTATKQGITGLVPSTGVNSHFLARYLEANSALLNRFAQGTTFEEIRPYILRRIEIPVPPLEEQRKIASVLYSVDELIDVNQRLIQATRCVRRGLLQGFFGEQTSPYGESDDWPEENLSQHVTIVSGAHVTADKVNKSAEGVPYLTGPEDFSGVTVSISKYTESPTSFCEPGDTLVTVKGSGCGSSAYADRRACISRQLKALRAEPSLRPEYLFYAIQASEEQLSVLAEGSAIPGLSNSHLKAVSIPLPSIEIQERVAGILGRCDSLINETQEYVVRLQRLKKGLMQDLLAGEVRTKDVDIEVHEEVAAYG